ncbi:low-complexity protein, partial [Fischerella thermalis WC441]
MNRKDAKCAKQKKQEHPTNMRSRNIIGLLMLLLFLFPLPAFPQAERTPLTLELLQERLRTPTVREGSLSVDLRQMMIDLRPENAAFRDAFYQLLRKELQKTGSKPLGLDLSNSLIQGDFIGSDLGLRTPLYAQAIAPIFTAAEQEQLESLRVVCLQSLTVALPSSKDCRSLLATPAAASDISVFRGSLVLEKTHFTGKVQFSNTFFLQSVNVQG